MEPLAPEEIEDGMRLAMTILRDWTTNHDGRLIRGAHAYECFRYQDDGVTLIFYPHTVNTGNQHIRVRSQHSKDTARAADMLDALVQHTVGCKFTVNNVSPIWPRPQRLQALREKA